MPPIIEPYSFQFPRRKATTSRTGGALGRPPANPRRGGSLTVIIRAAKIRPGRPTVMNTSCQDRTAPTRGRWWSGAAARAPMISPPATSEKPPPRTKPMLSTASARGSRSRGKLSASNE